MRALLSCTLAAAVACVHASYWMEDIAHRGRSPYHPDPNYQVFRNVKDFGATGNGVTDDTAAINAAISSGGRCEPGACKGNTVSPATVYFPPGTYLISNSIVDLYYTQLIGDPTNRPTILAAPTFSNHSFGLIDSNVYQPGGSLAWNSTDVFFRQIRNLVVDTTSLPPDFHAVGIHWPSSQATSITNVAFHLSNVAGNNHTGLFIEEGSGGLLSDLYFRGGGKAAVLGNQQFTARNLRFEQADIAINMPWDWGWTYRNINFRDCGIGIQMDSQAKSVGSINLIDSSFVNVDTAIYTTRPGAGMPGSNGTLILENVRFDNVKQALSDPSGGILDQSNIRSGVADIFIMGHVLNDTSLLSITGYYQAAPRAAALIDNRGQYNQHPKPQYEHVPAQGFMSARSFGAVGDGSTDDTAKLSEFFRAAAQQGYVAYIDAGIYMISDTIYIPPNSRIVGEAQASVLMAVGAKFQDVQHPRPVIQVAQLGEFGYLEWSDTIVSTRGGCAGAILIQYNLFTEGLPSGMWDVHTRIGGCAGTDLQLAQCPAVKGDDHINPGCMAAYMSMHITKSAGGLYSENCWLWVADHDMEDPKYRRLSVFAGRGLLVESDKGRIWLSATGSEHHVLYQYQFANTKDIFLGHTQTESPYFQPHPPASLPFPHSPRLNDPDFVSDCAQHTEPASCQSAWGIRILNSTRVVSYGMGLYSFFDTYNDTCAVEHLGHRCQQRILTILGNSSGIKFEGLNTIGTNIMVQQDGYDLVPGRLNNSTFADTLALYQP